MGRLLVALGALSALGFLAYRAVTSAPPSATERAATQAERNTPSAPKQTLNNVREKARSIEDNDQKYIDDMAEKTKE